MLSSTIFLNLIKSLEHFEKTLNDSVIKNDLYPTPYDDFLKDLPPLSRHDFIFKTMFVISPPICSETCACN